MEKLQEGTHTRETKQVSQSNPPERETIKVGAARGLLHAGFLVYLRLTESKHNVPSFKKS